MGGLDGVDWLAGEAGVVARVGWQGCCRLGTACRCSAYRTAASTSLTMHSRLPTAVARLQATRSKTIGKAEPSYDRAKTIAPFGVGLPLRQLLGGQHDVLAHQRLGVGVGWVGGWVGRWGMRRRLHGSMWRHSLQKVVFPSIQLQAASFG